MRPTRTIAAACLLAAMVSPCAVSQDQTQDQQNAGQREWEVLREIPPYGPLEWDMTIPEAIEAVSGMEGVENIQLDFSGHGGGFWALMWGGRLTQESASAAEEFAWYAKTQSLGNAKTAQYPGFEHPLIDSGVWIYADRVEVFGVPCRLTLYFRFSPGLIETAPDRLLTYQRQDAGPVTFAHRLESVTIENIEQEPIQPADYEHVYESLILSCQKRFAPYKQVDEYEQLHGQERTGAYYLWQSADGFARDERSRRIDFRYRVGCYAVSDEESATSFEARFDTQHKDKHDEPHTRANLEIRYYRGVSVEEDDAEAYRRYLEEYRKRNPRQPEDISDDL